MEIPGPSIKRSASPTLEPVHKKSALSSSPDSQQSANSEYKGFEENLICIICQEIFHDCYSCQPCMHSFCAGCYSDWKLESSQCPTCRKEVKSVHKNHTLNNLCSAYLNINPKKRRSEEELLKLDKRNKLVTQTNQAIKKVFDADEGSSDESSEIIEEREDEFSRIFNLRNPFKCRECIGFSPPDSNNQFGRSNTGNICQEGAIHLICSCCYKLVPSVPPLTDRKCVCCGSFFCHMYWKCSKPGCRGCLAKFKDMDLDEKHLGELISKNTFESQILKDYLFGKHIKIKDLLTHCLQKLDSSEFTSTKCPSVRSEDIVCYCCALSLLKELAYNYRANIPNSELPADVTSRPNCYWGANCKTQVHSPHHARKFNHICAQTRFT